MISNEQLEGMLNNKSESFLLTLEERKGMAQELRLMRKLKKHIHYCIRKGALDSDPVEEILIKLRNLDKPESG